MFNVIIRKPDGLVDGVLIFDTREEAEACVAGIEATSYLVAEIEEERLV